MKRAVKRRRWAGFSHWSLPKEEPGGVCGGSGAQVRGRLSQPHDLFNTSSPDAQFGPVSVTPRRSCPGELMQQEEEEERQEIRSFCSRAALGSPPGLPPWLRNWSGSLWLFFLCPDQRVLILQTGKQTEGERSVGA